MNVTAITGTSLACSGISLGCALAIVMSYSAYHSVWWAFVHGLFGWLTLIYWAIAGWPA